jgi:hypothetical protein
MEAILEKGRRHLWLVFLAIFAAPGLVRADGTSIMTTPGGTVVLGSGGLLKDTGILSGGIDPTGSLTFSLQNPSNMVVDTETVVVANDGTYFTPTGYSPLTAGAYTWTATYSGDSHNPGVASGTETELVTSAPPPSLMTTPGGSIVLGSGGLLKDSGTLTGGFNPTGTLTFFLQDPSSIVVDTETVVVANDGTYSTQLATRQSSPALTLGWPRIAAIPTTWRLPAGPRPRW